MKFALSAFRALMIVMIFSVALLKPDQFNPLPILAITGVLFVASVFVPKMSGHAMDTIAFQQARGIYTAASIGLYREMPIVYSFLRSFFPSVTVKTKLISIEVRRGREKVAVDVIRGTGANMNKRTRSTQKMIEPPAYAEALNVNELDIYDVAIGSSDPAAIMDLSRETAEAMMEITNMIERAYEKQCSEVLTSGVITLKNGDNIDFQRKAGSLVDGGGATYWTVATVDPMAALIAGGKFLREEGKAQGGVYNAILGANSLNALLNNPIFQKKYDLKKVELGEIREPQRNAVGGTLHGRVSAGSYMVNIWSYSEVYDDINGNSVSYIDEELMIMVPENPNFKMAFGLTPRLLGDSATTDTTGGYTLREYIDWKRANHVMEQHSAGVAVPIAIDQIYTQKVA